MRHVPLSRRCLRSQIKFELRYQPLLNLERDEICGFETLALDLLQME
jgi:hypothetical protein